MTAMIFSTIAHVPASRIVVAKPLRSGASGLGFSAVMECAMTGVVMGGALLFGAALVRGALLVARMHVGG